jgi:hypothetical protein
VTAGKSRRRTRARIRDRAHQFRARDRRRRRPRETKFNGTAAAKRHCMKSNELPTLTSDELTRAHGGLAMDPAAKWIMQRESGGNSHAGHLYSKGRGDGTRGNQSSAFGAFQMINAQRKHYMGSNYQSTDLGQQYSAASHYVKDRYGSWSHAESFWKSHHWY